MASDTIYKSPEGEKILKAFLHLLKNFRIYAPDTIGHPGRSAQTVLSSRDNSYGEWATDVIGGIGLERAGAIGISYGGGYLQDWLRLSLNV